MKNWEDIKNLKRIAWVNITDDDAAGWIRMPSGWVGSVIVSTGGVII